jgi:hypothetical protein
MAFMNNRGKQPSMRRTRPVWMTVLIFVIGFIVYAMNQKGLVGGAQSGGQAGGQAGTQQTSGSSSNSQGGTASGSSGAPSQTRPSTQPASQPGGTQPKASTPATPRGSADDGGIAELFRKQQSDTWIETSGVIKKSLPDDSSGDKHQRFIVRVATGIEILIAHNIDVAPRVPAEEGDTIMFRGEYEWTEKGGTVHFTHVPKFKRRDPGGWIEFEGKRYE